TVWVGLDHRLDEHNNPLPLVFEKLIDGPEDTDVVERYGTDDAAQAGHRRHVVNTAADITDAVVTDLQ
ncbi:hypothetical protein V3G68_25730, partial [Escherichia coli]|uniref:hypothetical protein n=1 Tax=Escherichia coli TaxID=562 RepID=UPI003593F8A8